MPTSPRNRLMYFISNEKTSELHEYVKFLLKSDTSLASSQQFEEVHDYQPTPKKKCKQSAWIISVTQCAVFEEVGADLESFSIKLTNNAT